MYKKNIFGYELKARSEKQLDEMYELLNFEDYTNPKFIKYFHVWVSEGPGLYWFPKEQYYGGFIPYAVALLHYADGRLREKVYESDYVNYKEYENGL